MSANKKRIFQEVNLTERCNEAALSVNDSFAAALECLPIILKGVEQPTTAQAILLCGFALMHQREMHQTDQLDAWLDIIESLDFIAASKPDSPN